MKKYIPLDTLVTEIEKRLSYYKDLEERNVMTEYAESGYYEVKQIKRLLDTIEVKEISDKYDGFLGKELKTIDDEINRLERLKVKEVDLEKEWKEFLKDGDVGFREIAKHFFELGLKAQKVE